MKRSTRLLLIFVLSWLVFVAGSAALAQDPAADPGDGEKPRELVDVLRDARGKLLRVPVSQNRSRLTVLDEFLREEEARVGNLRSRLRGEELAIGRAREALSAAGGDAGEWERALTTLEELVRSRQETRREIESAEAAVERLRSQREVVSRNVRDYERIRDLVEKGDEPPEVTLDPSALGGVPVLPDSPSDRNAGRGIDTDVALALRDFAVQTGNPDWRERWIERLRSWSPGTYARWLARNDPESFMTLRRRHEEEFRSTLKEEDPGRYALIYGAAAEGPGGPSVNEKEFLRPR